MTDTQLHYRRPPGPDQPVTLGLDAETLARLQSLSRQNVHRLMAVMVECCDRRAFLSRDSTRDLSVVMKARHLRELLDELMTLIVAGFETSANTLNWVWYLIAKHPGVETRLIDEAQRVVPNVSAITAQNLGEMTYTQQVLEEVLRLYPPVWLFTRRSHADDDLEDFDVPAGTDIYLSPFVLHRTDHYWPVPDRFDPERFVPTDQPKKERPFFPFSLGPRRCLGEFFSFLEMKVHLGLLLPRFRMSLVKETKPELELAINLRVADDIHVRPAIR